MAEITALHEILNDNPYFCPNNGKCLLVPLHSSLTNEEQNLVFKKTDKHVRKIVLSTNIAETSITIDDCVFVIDSGRMKEKRFDSNKNMESLETVWVSRANALQRKGRAGRVMPGVCIHLYTRHCFDYIFISQPVPEIQRVPLEQLLLKIKMLPYFSGDRIIEPPSNESITGAITRLQNLGAFNEFCDLTALGKHLASLPVDVRIGKLILFGTIFCCIDSALTIAACLSYKSPFCWMKVSSQGKHAGMSFANENFLSVKTLTTLADIKTQFLELLVDIGFVPRTIKLPRKLNIHGDNPRLLSAILCAALYPNIVKVLTPEKQYTHSISGAIPMNQKAEELKFETKEEKVVVIHPSSVNHNISSFPSPYLVYQEKIKTSRVFIRDCTLVPVLPLVLFSAGTIRVELYCGQFVVSLGDGWILFTVQSNQVAELLESIKQEFITLLEEKIKDPRMNLQTHPKGRRIVSTIVNLVTYG
ncbi:hypothetical protein AAG570_008394 [Ranatra chinensis]|uniref:Helicase C-terminal domain-containing protein n=1 Tax=Ranatra chinensis TaxID=642074 RepID=A0ABD0YQS3_9HEMI